MPQLHRPEPQQPQSLVLPEVPNMWDEMNSSAGDGMSPADSVEYTQGSEGYTQGSDDSNMANDAMLLIMHAMQARSEGRSLAEERRISAEQYWRQMEENGEADFLRLSNDGNEAAST